MFEESIDGTCSGLPLESEKCNFDPCPPAIDCVWSEWGDWSRIIIKEKKRIKMVTEANGGSCDGQSTWRESCDSNVHTGKKNHVFYCNIRFIFFML